MKTTKIGNNLFFVPEAEAAAEDAVELARHIILSDEYQLLPIRRSGHWPEYFVDVGGNCGAFAIAVANVFPGSRVLWVEPYEDVAECYRQNTKELPLQCYEASVAAVSDEAQEIAELIIFPNHPGGNFVDGIWDPAYAPVQPEPVQVPTRRVSDLLREHSFPRIDVLKVDCEGSEAVVLKNLSETGWLHRTRWVRFEWHGQQNRRACEELLSATHIARTHGDQDQAVGFGIAHSRLDSENG